MSTTVSAPKTNSIARTFRALEMSDKKKLPSRIQLMKAGSWPSDSNKGALEITVTDLHEYVRNFDAGVGMPGGGEVGIPIDFMHESWNKAAAWIKGLVVESDTLYADPVEWTAAGEASVISGEFKCISPSFVPACLGMWTDPEDPSITARNVLVGAGLTNIPFFKDLKPILASQSSEEGGEKNIIYINAAKEKEHSMTLEEVRGKDVGALSEDEKSFLKEHEADLTTEEKTKFGMEPAPVETPEPVEPEAKVVEEEKVPEPVAASNQEDGTVRVDAARLAHLEAAAKRYETKEATELVEAHIARGAIKADQRDNWVTRYVDANETDRQWLTQTMKALPSNEVMASEKGTKEGVEKSALEQLQAKAAEIQAADKNLTLRDALIKARQDNPELVKQASEEA